MTEEKIRRSLAGTGSKPVDDPFTELSRLAGQAVSWKDTLADIVDHLSGQGSCPHCGGDIVGATGEWRYEASGAGTEQLRSELGLFERSLDRCSAVLATMAKLNIDERMARISEVQATVVIDAVNAALTAAGLTGEAAAAARKVAARKLRAAS